MNQSGENGNNLSVNASPLHSVASVRTPGAVAAAHAGSAPGTSASGGVPGEGRMRLGQLVPFVAFLRNDGLVALSAATAMIGVAGAMISTTASLFLAEAVRATPLMIGLFFAGRAVLEMSSDLAVGTLSDWLGSRRSLLALCSILSAIGAFCYMELRNYYEIFACGVIFFGIGGSGFAQLLAYTRQMADKSAMKATALNSVMRSITSVTWIFGPPLGFFLIGKYGFSGVFIPIGMLYFLAGLLCLWRLPNLRVERDTVLKVRSPFHELEPSAKVLMAVIVLLVTVNSIYQIDISLTVTRVLRLGPGFTGWLLGLGAALEVPVLIFIASRADHFGFWRLMLGAALSATLFFCTLPLATTKLELLLLQLPNAFWTSLVLSLPATMLQNIAPNRLGTASSLYSFSFKTGIMLGGTTAGVATEWAGYINVFWVCGALSTAAVCLLISEKAYGHDHSPV